MSPLARHPLPLLLSACLTLLLAAGLLIACDSGSSDSTTAGLFDNSGRQYDFSGHYARANDAGEAVPLVQPAGRQSGQPLMWLRLLQYGSVLEAYDSAGLAWSGSISMLAGGAAQLQLRGRTTAGADARIAGTLRYADGNSTLDAAWIEPAFSGSLFATATVNPPTAPASPSGGDSDDEPDDSGGDDSDNGSGTDAATLSISPSRRWFVPYGGDSGTYTASGGTPPYTWYVSATVLGTVSPITGATVTYTTTRAVGTNTLRVVDASGASAVAYAEYH